ncbi:hypothetical protein GP486_002921 [Trichoglossum hirsutum]|uniref:Pre-mRNA-splicing factor n=1 Tax=Trichoglossum hirsutum TaxID=265104 RepID=A0A9P8LDU8_9PEZI|nr:hypothetical protein GP486_002921 [Trichoglossum hirsutum]
MEPLTPSSTLKDGTKRRHASSLSDSEDDDKTGTAGRPQLVSAFDHSAGGAIGVDDVEEEREPLVIPSQKNRDWREESLRKRGKNLLPPEVQQARAGGAQTVGHAEGEATNGGVQAYGLTFVKRAITEKDEDVNMATEQTLKSEEQVIQPQAKTEDELALEALMSHDRTGTNSTLVLPSPEASQDAPGHNHRIRSNHISEDDAYRLDVASRPDSASLDDYIAVPVEEFGAALLRGMGWKEGDVVGKRKDQVSKPRVVERRPALLGIGAKELSGGVGEELGAWGKGIKKKGRPIDKMYSPVVLKNSKTGEMLTEDELKAKKEDYERTRKGLEEDWRERRDKNLARDSERKEGGGESRGSSRALDRSSDRDHRHHYRRDSRDHRDYHRRGSSDSRNRSSRHERSRSSDNRHRRRDDDSERRERDNDRDRRRRDREESEGSLARRRNGREKERYEEKSRRRQEVF